MASNGESDFVGLIYRRARPSDFNDEALDRGVLSPSPGLFEITKEGAGLSVFLADLTTPFRVLEHHIAFQRLMRETGTDKERARAERLLADADSVDRLVGADWRVVELSASTFPTGKFAYDSPSLDELDRGHFSIHGSKQDFRENSLTARQACSVLPIDLCLDSSLRPLR